MPRRARIEYVSLKSSLVNLPISIYGPLLERNIRPQSLAIHLSLAKRPAVDGNQPSLEVYVGWTGFASASSLAHFNAGPEKGMETIEIDPQFAHSLGLSLGDIVDIGLLHDLPLAKSVTTEPVTSDDWEIIELHASHVESTLLSQVRVAVVGQEIDVWVLGRTRARLRVVSIDPISRSKAALLTTNTEVSIAPKSRPSGRGSGGLNPLRANDKLSSFAAPPSRKDTEMNTRILRVLPTSLVRILSSVFNTHSETVAYVSPMTFLQLSDGLLARGDPISNTSFFCKAQFRRLSPPLDPSSTFTSTGPSIQTSALRIASIGKSADTYTDVLLRSSSCLPSRHVVFIGAMDKWDEWDLVRVTVVKDQPLTQVANESSNHGSNDSESSAKYTLVGVEEIITGSRDFCTRSFAYHSSNDYIRAVPALLLTGSHGSGKTTIMKAVARILECDPRVFAYTLFVDIAKFSDQPPSKLKLLFRYWLDKAAWHRPSILLFDNLDKLLSAEVEHTDSFSTRQMTELFLSIFSPSARAAASHTRGVVMIATAQSQATLHPLLHSMHLFEEIIKIKSPGSDARRDILAHIVRSKLALSDDLIEDPVNPLNFTTLATGTEGYSATDLQDLVARAIHQAAIRASRCISIDNAVDRAILSCNDFDVARVGFTPLSLRDVKLQKSDVAWSDIGGLHETRRVLRETLEWPTKYGAIFAKCPLRLRSGLLLYGFPGCGKTLLASAVAKECGLNFISVKGPELLNKYIGASEKSVRDLFDRASAAKPCVLFFDEFDSIAPKRGHDSTGVTDRVVNQMLTQMDGAEGLDGVYVLAATSRPDLIDSALLRPGRLDKSLLCNMPDTEERKEIFQALGRKIKFSPLVDLDMLARATEGYSGADLQALVYNAHLDAIHSTITAQDPVTDQHSSNNQSEASIEYISLTSQKDVQVQSRAETAALRQRLNTILSAQPSLRNVAQAEQENPRQHEIQHEHLLHSLKTTRPSVPPQERERLGRIYRSFVSERSGDLPVPPDVGGVGNRVSLM